VPGFEGGWICKNCWKANRLQDLRCYRCHALAPDVHEVPLAAQPSRKLHLPSVRPRLAWVARRVTNGLAAIARSIAATAGAVWHLVAAIGRSIAAAAMALLGAMRTGRQHAWSPLQRAAAAISRDARRLSRLVAVSARRGGQAVNAAAIAGARAPMRAGRSASQRASRLVRGAKGGTAA
jgi:hypothetical protein